MKRRHKELDVDFVGGQEPLNADDMQRISDYFQSKKAEREKRKLPKKIAARKKVA